MTDNCWFAHNSGYGIFVPLYPRCRGSFKVQNRASDNRLNQYLHRACRDWFKCSVLCTTDIAELLSCHRSLICQDTTPPSLCWESWSYGSAGMVSIQVLSWLWWDTQTLLLMLLSPLLWHLQWLACPLCSLRHSLDVKQQVRAELNNHAVLLNPLDRESCAHSISNFSPSWSPYTYILSQHVCSQSVTYFSLAPEHFAGYLCMGVHAEHW